MKDRSMTDTPDFTPAPIPTEQELASFDPHSTPSPVEVVGDVRIAAEPSLGGLSPDMRSRVLERLATCPLHDRAAQEQRIIREELQLHSQALRVLSGLGSGANEYQREHYGIQREVYDLERQAAHLQFDIEEVVGHTTEYDSDGTPVPVPVYRLAPEARRGREEALREIQYKLTQIERERPRRLSEAAKRTQDRIAAQNEQLEIQSKAKAKATEILKEEEIERKAQAFAANRRNTLG